MMGKGQSLAEYAFVFAVVIGAVAVFQWPMQRAVLQKTFAQVTDLCHEDCLKNAGGNEENCNCLNGQATTKRRKQDTRSWSSGWENVTLAPGAKVDRTWDTSSYMQTAPPVD